MGQKEKLDILACLAKMDFLDYLELKAKPDYLVSLELLALKAIWDRQVFLDKK